MKLDNISRFIVEKNAYEYLKKEKNIQNQEICDFSWFLLKYLWDKDFWIYNRVNFDKIYEIHKYYPNIELFLKNINLKDIYKNIENTSIQILEKIIQVGSSLNKNLVIISMTPIEKVILWSIFKELWINNIAYNFNKQILINSANKTFEAVLYLLSYENSKYLKEETLKIIEEIKIKNINTEIINKNSFIIFDENDYYPEYEYLNIDYYIKNQIWFSIPKNIYRIDEYPKSDFLIKKEVKNIIFIDNDNNLWKNFDYYKNSLEKENLWIQFKYERYNLEYNRRIWIYEDYLISKNEEYKNYKQEIEQKAWKTAKNLENKYSFDYKQPQTWKEKNSIELRKKLIPLLVLYPVLFISFLINDLWRTTSTSWNWSTNSTNINYIWGIWNVWWISNSSVSSSKSSSSIIKSFWWWWFSKWSSS